MTWKIVSDSGTNIRSIANLDNEIQYELVPLIIAVEEENIIDNESADIPYIVHQMEISKHTSTACPGPESYAQTFESADNILCLTLSSNVSGSYNAAMIGRELALEKSPHKKIHIMDTRTAGGEMDLLIHEAIRLIQQGHSFNDFVSLIQSYHEKTFVNFLLESVDNLVKNGRISRLVGQMIGLLNIRLIGQRSAEGTIELAQKARGTQRAIQTLYQEMQKNGYQGGRVMLGHVLNPELSKKFEDHIKATYPQADITTYPCSGLCSYYAQRNGLIVGYEKN